MSLYLLSVKKMRGRTAVSYTRLSFPRGNNASRRNPSFLLISRKDHTRIVPFRLWCCIYNRRFHHFFIFANIEPASTPRLWLRVRGFWRREGEQCGRISECDLKCPSKIIQHNKQNKSFNMGPVASFLKENDRNDHMKKAAKEALDVSLNLIQTKFELFESKLNNRGVGSTVKVPGTYLLSAQKIVSANVTHGSQGNKYAISRIVSKFTQGNSAISIGNILFKTLDTILGNFATTYDQQQDYVLVANSMGGVFRIDYLVVQQKLQASGITTGISTVFGSYLIVSSVSKTDVKDESIYKMLIERQFADQTFNMRYTLLKLVKEEKLSLEEAQLVNKMTFKELQFSPTGELVDEKGRLIYPPSFDFDRISQPMPIRLLAGDRKVMEIPQINQEPFQEQKIDQVPEEKPAQQAQ